MDSEHPFKKAAAFLAGGLLVTWIGGTCGATAYKAVYSLAFGAWPETGLYRLAPAVCVRYVLSLPKDTLLSDVLLFLLTRDILTYLAVLPPLLLLPCLAILLHGQRPHQAWRMAVRPFAAGSALPVPGRVAPTFRRDRGMNVCGGATKSIIRGTVRTAGGRGKMPPAAGRG